jgi:hypothetical protein
MTQTIIDGDPVRHDRPPLRARLASLDARLRTPEVLRTVATATVGLLLLQGVVVLEHVAGDDPAAPEIAALESTEPSPPADAERVEAAATADALPATAGDETDTPVTTGASGTDAATDEGAAVRGHTAPSTDPATDADAAGTDVSTPATRGAAAATGSGAAAPAADPAQQRFEQAFPAQAHAGQSTARPDTTRWAVLIGVNEHQGRTRDNLGSRQDAEDLARHLRSLGWRDDHVVLLTDGGATRERIVEAFRWLARKADRDSVVAIHYSGHTKQWHGRDIDGDGEVTDEALWPSDNRFITDREVGQLMSQIRAGRLWFNVGACEAAGFNDWGITGPNRIATYSSGEHQKSYEDPSVGNSVWGYQLIEEGLIAGHADANGDGNVTVEEAFRFATPRAHHRTKGQRPHGPQTPEVSDRYPGEFDLRIPPPPRPSSSSERSDDDDRSCLLCPPTSSVTRR